MVRRRHRLNHRHSGSGPPYVLIHGLGGEACVWEPVLAEPERRFDVIAVDLPGFGRSPALAEGTVPTPRALAGAVAELLDELGLGAVHAAGNSLGGWVALELARAGRARTVLGVCPAGCGALPWPRRRRRREGAPTGWRDACGPSFPS
jgi:pimeloyl-ACP methyl ester carboxylesterase